MTQQYKVSYLLSLNYDDLLTLLNNYRNQYYQLQKLNQKLPSTKYQDELALYKQALYLQSKYATAHDKEHYNSLKSQIAALQQEREKLTTPINKKPFIIGTIIGTILTFGGILIILLIAFLIWKIMQNSKAEKIKAIDTKLAKLNEELISSAQELDAEIDSAYENSCFDLINELSGLDSSEDSSVATASNSSTGSADPSPYVEWKEEFNKTIAKNDPKYLRLKKLADQEIAENQVLQTKQQECEEQFIQLPGEFANNIAFVDFAINELNASQAMSWQELVRDYKSPLKADM